MNWYLLCIAMIIYLIDMITIYSFETSIDEDFSEKELIFLNFTVTFIGDLNIICIVVFFIVELVSIFV